MAVSEQHYFIKAHIFSRLIDRCFFIFLIGLVSCSDQENRNSGYGITLFEIQVESEELSDLNNTSFAKESVPATLIISGHEYTVNIKHAGKSSIDSHKRNINVSFSATDKYRGFKKIRLASQSSDPSSLKAVLGFELYRSAGLFSSEIVPVALYLNNKYQGLYYLIEPVNHDYLVSRKVDARSLYQGHHNDRLLSESINFRTAFDSKGANKQYTDVKRMVGALLDESQSAHESILSMVVVTSFFSHVMSTVLLDNWDGFDNNFMIYNTKSDLRFRWIPWDLDSILQRDPPGTGVLGDGNYTRLIFKIPELKEQYLKAFDQFVNRDFDYEEFKSKFYVVVDSVEMAFAADRVLSSKNKTAKEFADEMMAIFDVQLTKIKKEITIELEKLEN